MELFQFLVLRQVGGDDKSKKAEQSYFPAPRTLPGFPNAGPREFNKESGRYRWKLPDGSILEWDKQHGGVEVYDKSGKNHQGEYDPETGEKRKDGNAERSTPKTTTTPSPVPSYQPLTPPVATTIRNTTTIIAAGIILWEVVKWSAAVAAALPSGGTSLAAAAVVP